MTSGRGRFSMEFSHYVSGPKFEVHRLFATTSKTSDPGPASPINLSCVQVLPHVIGPKEYRQERALVIRIDEILTISGLETEFIALAMAHCGFAPARESAKRIESFSRRCVLALRGNIARHFKGMDHRDFGIRLADSPLF